MYAYIRQENVQSQFDEFVEDSKELEAELESQLEQAEKKISDLSKIKQSFELENDKLKVGIETVQTHPNSSSCYIMIVHYGGGNRPRKDT